MQILNTFTAANCGRTKTFDQNSGLKKKTVNRWAIYKQLCVAKSAFNLNDRSLAVLNSLLSFLPQDEIDGTSGLVVFPSNRQLSLRAHGMPESTLRRHLASLIDAGIIARKDSPTRKRYAHKDREGGIELAFGFSLAPLLQRSTEIAAKADKILSDQKVLKRLRDEVSVIRREIASVFSNQEEGSNDAGGSLGTLFIRFRNIVDAIPRRASCSDLECSKTNLEAIRDELSIALKNMEIDPQMSGNVAQIERQHNDSLQESLIESKNIERIDLKSFHSNVPEPAQPAKKCPGSKDSALSLDQVLRTCPDIQDYGGNGIASWRELQNASRLVSSFLGISQSAYQDAVASMGIEATSTAIAWILQKLPTINSPGGYLRSLTKKSRAGGFSINQLLSLGMSANANRALA